MDNSQKLDNTLNLSLDVTSEEREKSRELSVGYNAEARTWRVIVKYSGELSEIEEAIPGSQAISLFNQYGIIRVPEQEVDRLAALPQIQYVEKPKQIFSHSIQGGAHLVSMQYSGEPERERRGKV